MSGGGTGDAGTPFEVIVPARNEAAALRRTAPALAAALRGTSGTAIYVLNGTDDDSADVVSAVPDLWARIVEVAAAGKAGALTAGDRAATRGVRFYLDADVFVPPGAFAALLAPLLDGRADLVAPRIRVDFEGAGPLSRRVGRVWGDQLARRPDAFMALTGYGPDGLRRRGPWRDLMADDDWARDRIAPHRRAIVEGVVVGIEGPRDVASWIAVRSRWLRGRRELRRAVPGTARPRRVAPRGSSLDLAAYLAVRLAATPVAMVHDARRAGWSVDRSTRRAPEPGADAGLPPG